MSKYFDGKHLFGEPQIEQCGNNMVMTGVMKPVKRKIVCLDTKLCDDFQYYTTTTAQLTNSITITIPERVNEIKSMKVKNVELPITMYNVSATLANNTFKITNNSTSATYTIVLADGNYTASTLATEINSKINSAGIGSVLTVSTTGTNTVFTNTAGATTFTIDFSIGVDGVVDKYNFRDKIGWMLGFRNNNYKLVGAVSVSSEAVRNLDGLTYVYLVVDEYTNDKSTDFLAYGSTMSSPKNVLAKISIDKVAYPFGSCLVANEANGLLIANKRTYTNKVDIQRLNIRLVDHRGINVNLMGRDFSFSLEIEHE